MSHTYKQQPSKLMGIDDAYTSFCLDEACAYIISKLENEEEPTFKKEYTSFKDIYANYN